MSNGYTYSVPFTEKQLYEDYYVVRMSQAEIARKYGTSQKVVWRAMKKCGMISRKAAKRYQSGSLNHCWKGGRQLVNYKTPLGYRYLDAKNSRGYWLVLKPDHPNANKRGYVMEHIVVALEAAGRDRLDPGECVHHINFIRQDNRPENLEICTLDKHREYHGKLEQLTRQLLERGIVRFDQEEGYIINE